MQTSDQIFEQVKPLIEDRKLARHALAEVEGMKGSTMEARDHHFETVYQLTQKIEALHLAFDEAVERETAPATVEILASDLYALVEAARYKLIGAKAREHKNGVSWAVRVETDALRAIVERVSAPQIAQAVA